MKKYVVWYELNGHRVWVGSFDTALEAADSVVPVAEGRFHTLPMLEVALPDPLAGP